MSRRTQILRLLLRYRGSGVFAGMNLDPAAINEYEVPAEGTPDQFVSDLESLGPTFVKLGQMLSTRPDIVPPEFATALERMQENTSSVPVERIRQIIEEELGVSVNKAFSFFDRSRWAAPRWRRCTALRCAMARQWRSRCRNPKWPRRCVRIWTCSRASPPPPTA